MAVSKSNMVLNTKFKIPPALELFKSIPKAKHDWKLKTPMQKWCCFYGIGRVAYNVTRIPLFRENINDVHWFGCFSLISSTIAVFLSIYTIWYHQLRGEIQISLSSTCLASTLVAVCKQHQPLNLYITNA